MTRKCILCKIKLSLITVTIFHHLVNEGGHQLEFQKCGVVITHDFYKKCGFYFPTQARVINC